MGLLDTIQAAATQLGDQFRSAAPGTYGFLNGLLGMEPGGSVFEPGRQATQNGTFYGNMTNAALGVLPVAAPAVKFAGGLAGQAINDAMVYGAGPLAKVMPQPLRLIEAGAKQFPAGDAMALAQQRAALPTAQGGLGLPATNTAADRAAAMGFEGGWAHGSPQNNISVFQPSKTGAEGPGIYATNHLPEASTYAGNQAGATVYPVMVNRAQALDVGAANPYGLLGATEDEELLRKLAAQNKTGIVKTQEKTPEWLVNHGGLDMPERQHYVSMNPDNFRSRFAAFDPWRRTAAIAAAMGVAAPDLMAKEVKPK